MSQRSMSRSNVKFEGQGHQEQGQSFGFNFLPIDLRELKHAGIFILQCNQNILDIDLCLYT